jgi:hypothetical protein
MKRILTGMVIMGTALALPAVAQDGDPAAELAKKLANPIAALISLPLQYNFDTDYGVNDDGTKQYINVQPVIPFSISENWNVISRTIIPLIDQQDIPLGTDKSGLGDVVQSLFFSPKAPSRWGNVIWGVGPVALIPTATDEVLGGEKWGAGPTAVALKQTGPWTVGFLGNHLWSFAGEDERSDVNATFLQPFMGYITKTKTTLSMNTETTYNWDAKDSDQAWSVPVNVLVAQMFKIGDQIMQFQIGPRYWIESPDAGPEGWGVRAQLTLLFPK